MHRPRLKSLSLWLLALSACAVCVAACSEVSFCCVAGAPGICAFAGPQALKAVKVHNTTKRRVALGTCRMASFALFRLCREFGD